MHLFNLENVRRWLTLCGNTNTRTLARTGNWIAVSEFPLHCMIENAAHLLHRNGSDGPEFEFFRKRQSDSQCLGGQRRFRPLHEHQVDVSSRLSTLIRRSEHKLQSELDQPR